MGGAASAVNALEMLKEKLMAKEPITKKGVAEATEWKKREKAGTVEDRIGGSEVIDVRAAWTAWRWQRADCERRGYNRRDVRSNWWAQSGIAPTTSRTGMRISVNSPAKTCIRGAVQVTDRPSFCCIHTRKCSSLANPPRTFYGPMLISYYTPATAGMLHLPGSYRDQNSGSCPQQASK